MSDVGLDKNSRSRKVILCACQHFLSYNFDAVFIITNSLGRSACDRVNRRMAKFSNELAGLILPHDFYGSYLNSVGFTKDEDFEKKNFEFAGKTFAKVWRSVEINRFLVTAEYVTENSTIEELNLRQSGMIRRLKRVSIFFRYFINFFFLKILSY